ELLVLLAELRSTDAQGAALIEAYLDRRAQGWREGRAEEAAKEQARAPRGGRIRMPREEGYEEIGPTKRAAGCGVKSPPRCSEYRRGRARTRSARRIAS